MLAYKAPVCQRTSEAPNMVAYTVIYSSAANSIQSNYYILNVACVFHSCSRLQHFYDLPELHMMPSLVSEAQVIQ